MNPFILKNEELIRLDLDVRYFNLLFNDFYSDCTAEQMPNPGYVTKLFSDCRSFINATMAVKGRGLTPFERLFKENLVECLKAQYYYLDYFFLGEKVRTIESFIKKVYDYDPGRLREMFVTFDVVKDARMQQMGAVLVEHLIDASYITYLDFLKRILPQIKEELLEFSFKESVLPKELQKGGPPYPIDFEMILDSEMGAGWDEDVRILTINPDKFRIYKYRDKVAVNPGVAEDYLCHEIMHMAQGIYSSELPTTLRQDSPQVRSVSVAPITEGIATLFTRRLMERRMEKGTSAGFEFKLDPSGAGSDDEFTRVNLRKTELDYLASAIHFPQYRGLAEDYYTYLSLKALDDEKFDAREEFLWAMAEHGMRSSLVRGDFKEKVELLPSISDGTMYFFPYSLSYYVGYDLVHDIEREVVDTRGKAFMRSNRKRLDQIMFTGAWSVKVFRKWVNFALDHPKEFDAYREHQVDKWKARGLPRTDEGRTLLRPPSALLPLGFDLEGYRGARMFKSKD